MHLRNAFVVLLAGYFINASLAQLVEHALRKRMVVGSIPTGGFWQKKQEERMPRPGIEPETFRFPV